MFHNGSDDTNLFKNDNQFNNNRADSNKLNGILPKENAQNYLIIHDGIKSEGDNKVSSNEYLN